MCDSEIKTKNIVFAWIQSLRQVLKHGNEIVDGNEKLWEVRNVILKVENTEDTKEELSEYLSELGEEYFDQAQLLFSRGPNGNKLTRLSYGQRIYDYKGIDQIASVIKKLKNKPESKSATITLLDPTSENSHIPCISLMDFKIRNGVLEMTIYGRSIDVVKKLPGDLFALGKIQKNVAKELNVKVGSITMFIASLHAYDTDFDIMHKVVTRWRWNRKAVTWEKEIKDEDHYVNIENGYSRFMNYASKVLNETGAENVLDVGTGTGIVARLAKEYSDNVSGIDIAPKMIEVAESLAPDIAFVEGDALEIPYEDKMFDFVVSRGVLLSHIVPKNVDTLISEYSRIIDHGGTLVIDFLQNVPEVEADMHKEKGIFSMGAIIELLEKHGFRIIEFEEDPNKRVNTVHAKKL